jgi:hypothetical protein
MAQSVDGLKAAADTTKQIITLSTGIMTLTVTFAKEFKVGDGSLSVPLPLQISWGAFFLAILFAVFTLMAVTGSLSLIDRTSGIAARRKLANCNASNIRIPAALMIICFLIGLALTAIAGSSVVH